MLNRHQKMDCKEFIGLIPTWLESDLTGRDADRFLEHLDECDECREELHIQFLVKEGAARLESGEGFDLDRELGAKVNDYRRMLNNIRIGNRIVYGMEIISAVAIAFILVLVFMHM